MNLYLLRHGIAAQLEELSTQNDADRPLTGKGIKRMRREARGLRRFNIPFDAVVTSPLLRARQTADVVAAALGLESSLEELPDLAPETSVDSLLFNLTHFKNHSHLLLVGHEPQLSDLAAFLLTLKRDAKLGVALKKGGLCNIEIDTLPPTERGTLHWLITPKQLRQLARRGEA
jgi:phosphohistidine phosphatase